jgi:hypothetical protein
MNAQKSEKLIACVEAFGHIQQAIASGEVEWASALTDIVLEDMEALRKEVALPTQYMNDGLIKGLMMADERPIAGRAINGFIGLSMGWFIGQVEVSPFLDELDRLIETLKKTNSLLEVHLTHKRSELQRRGQSKE